MRRGQDLGSQPVRNLATNPRCERAGSLALARWNHAPNPRGVNLLTGYGSQTVVTVTGVANQPEQITTANKVSYNAGNANPGVIFMPNPDVNTLYTFSVWVFNEGGTSESIGLAQQSVTSGGSQGVPPGVWTKLSWTYTTHATIAYGMGVRIGSAAATGSFLVTGFMAEKASASMGPFFDGASGTTADFTHAWLGTANNSASTESAKPVLDMNTTGAGGKISFQCSDRAAGTQRFIRTVLDSSSSAAINMLNVVLPAGVARTDSVWIRTSRALSLQLRYRSNSGAAVNGGPNITTAANRWEEWRLFDSPSAGADMSLSVLALGGNVVAGDIIDVGPYMCVEGTYTGDFIHGNAAFSKWDVSADNGSSVGYPPQLLDIAGQPAVDIVGVGQNSASPVTVDAWAARTFYVVYETDAYTQAYNNCFTYGSSGSKGFLLQTAAAGSASLANRVDFPGGTANGAIVLGSGRLPRRHVVAFTFEQGLATSRSCLDGNNDVVSNWSVGTTGWDNGRVTTVAMAEIRALRALVFYGDHDRNTRLAISRYLGNKYGAYVA